MLHIRQAAPGDISRLAEILVFVKRMNYRDIFHEDDFSFNVLQVLPAAQEYIDNPDRLAATWVYDDGIVKGLVHIENGEICELYVDHFFQSEGIGGKLIEFAIREHSAHSLWVLEKNLRAIAFYRRHGFALTGERKLQPGTPEYIAKMTVSKE